MIQRQLNYLVSVLFSSDGAHDGGADDEDDDDDVGDHVDEWKLRFDIK